MSLTRRPLGPADQRRAGELALAYARETEGGQARYDELLAHTLVEYHPAAVIDALISLWVGTVRAFADDDLSLWQDALTAMVDEPVEEADDTMWNLW